MSSIDLGGRARRSRLGGWWFDLTYVHVVNRGQFLDGTKTIKYPPGDYKLGSRGITVGAAAHAWIPRWRVREFRRVGWERA